MGNQDRFQYVHEAFTPLFSAHLYLHTNKEAFLKHRKLYTGKKMNLTGVSGASSDFNTPEGIVLLIGVFAEGLCSQRSCTRGIALSSRTT